MNDTFQFSDTEKNELLKIIETPLSGLKGSLDQVVESVIQQTKSFMQIANQHGTSCYVYDHAGVKENIKLFKSEFLSKIKNIHPYYAVKSNPYIELLKDIVSEDIGLDVSSQYELGLALEAKAKKIIYTGPGKSKEDLELILQHSNIITLMIDSFQELVVLKEVLISNPHIMLRAGVRIYTEIHKEWKKFGIPLSRLGEFWEISRSISNLHLCGIQSHRSNSTIDLYEEIIESLGNYLEQNFSEIQKKQIQFIDFGGGLHPQNVDGYYDTAFSQIEILNSLYNELEYPQYIPKEYFLMETTSLKEYAERINRAIATHILSQLSCDIYCEPGRILSNPSLHILLKVMDKKDDDIYILDGGNNIIGWDKYSSEYVPIINLTHPGTKEIRGQFVGSLCTPDDIWGYFCYAENIEIGDILVIPNQGAYTYTLRQSFIRGLPNVHHFECK
ncbi:MAG: hypothetical protein WCO06_04690 [Candidatus Roizmanbacteria bacterium]